MAPLTNTRFLDDLLEKYLWLLGWPYPLVSIWKIVYDRSVRGTCANRDARQIFVAWQIFGRVADATSPSLKFSAWQPGKDLN